LFYRGHIFKILPLIEDQEIDARLSTGSFYWEGAVELSNKKNIIGRGFLELTGYSSPLRLQ
jgi:predicted secreted hydrolase